MGRTCGEPDEIKKNTHPKNTTALFREQVGRCPDMCPEAERYERIYSRAINWLETEELVPTSITSASFAFSHRIARQKA